MPHFCGCLNAPSFSTPLFHTVPSPRPHYSGRLAQAKALLDCIDLNAPSFSTPLFHTVPSPRPHSSGRLAQAKALLDCIDLNANGVVDYEEFLAATVHQQRLNKDELMKKAFEHFDTDGNGFITKEELAVALEGTGVDVQQV
eukprot:355939-Chlamydomonas_euryale.AAC.1